MTELEKLKKEVQVAAEATLAIERQAGEWRKEQEQLRLDPLYERKTQLEAEINLTQLSIDAAVKREFQTRLDEALAMLEAARANVNNAIVAEQLSKLPMREGTVLQEWIRSSSFNGVAWQRTGRVGVFQVFRNGDEVDERRHRWNSRRVRPGDLVIRMLLANRRPGKTVLPYSSYYNRKWLTSNVNPNEVRELSEQEVDEVIRKREQSKKETTP